jgi:hypothetical protein
MAVGEQQQRFGVDVVGRNPVWRRERMAGRSDEQERLLVQRQGFELAVAGVGGDHRRIDLALQDQRQQPCGQILDDRDRRLRQVADQRRQGVGHQIGTDGRNDADPQRSREWVARAARRRGDFGDRRQRAPGVLDDRFGARCDGDNAALALEDAHAEFRLQLEDLTAQRRLADVAGRRGAAEMTVVGDGDDVVEIAQVHRATLQ